MVQCGRRFIEATRNRSRCKLSSNGINKRFSRTSNNRKLLFLALSLCNRVSHLRLPLSLLTSDERQAPAFLRQCLCKAISAHLLTLQANDHWLNPAKSVLVGRLRVQMSMLAMSTAILEQGQAILGSQVYLVSRIRMAK